MRQHKIYYKGCRNYSAFTALKVSNYSQLFPIRLRLLIKGGGSSPPSLPGRPPEASRGPGRGAVTAAVGAHGLVVHDLLLEMEAKLRRRESGSVSEESRPEGPPAGTGLASPLL